MSPGVKRLGCVTRGQEGRVCHYGSNRVKHESYGILGLVRFGLFFFLDRGEWRGGGVWVLVRTKET